MPAPQPPEIPAPVPVALDARITALLVLDMTDALCGQVPACMQTVPAVKRLLVQARTAGARVVFSLGRAANQAVLGELAPRADEPAVRSSADNSSTPTWRGTSPESAR